MASITYDVPNLYESIDILPDLSYLILIAKTCQYLPHNSNWIKEMIFVMVERVRRRVTDVAQRAFVLTIRRHVTDVVLQASEFRKGVTDVVQQTSGFIRGATDVVQQANGAFGIVMPTVIGKKKLNQDVYSAKVFPELSLQPHELGPAFQSTIFIYESKVYQLNIHVSDNEEQKNTRRNELEDALAGNDACQPAGRHRLNLSFYLIIAQKPIIMLIAQRHNQYGDWHTLVQLINDSSTDGTVKNVTSGFSFVMENLYETMSVLPALELKLKKRFIRRLGSTSTQVSGTTSRLALEACAKEP
ncbi:unnamed protein product [Heligmosomoides polygyrus]|uniref:VPS13_C domain-containing protein n=1 Tax=Heligmosomoides polygyrus TaxID=6339 RepID=A0A3P8AKS8_HELPZ|nr:unnamed protein product [Heligmosomoides polygyrus]